jgi:hypothetical protein
MIRADRKNDSRRPKVGFGKTERMSTKASIPPEEEELDKAHRGAGCLSFKHLLTGPTRA